MQTICDYCFVSHFIKFHTRLCKPKIYFLIRELQILFSHHASFLSMTVVHRSPKIFDCFITLMMYLRVVF